MKSNTEYRGEFVTKLTLLRTVFSFKKQGKKQ